MSFVLAVGVVVAVLRVAEFVAGEHHRRTQREQQHADHVHGRLFACRNDVWIIGDAFDAEIGGMVHRRAIIIVFAVGSLCLERYLVRSVSVKPSWQDTKLMEAGAPRPGSVANRSAERRVA